MRCNATKLFSETARHFAAKVLLATGSALALLVFFAAHDHSPVLIQSRESKTPGGGPVFNRIAFSSENGQDLWVMQQSHFGPDAPPGLWDQITITVTRGARPTARFAQLASDAAGGGHLGEEAPKKARCYMCHANGPRVIRPETKDAVVTPTLWDRLRIMLWNLRIKTYGRFETTAQDKESDYRVQTPLANETLKIAACSYCHSDGDPEGFIKHVARGALRRQHYGAIDFMLANRLMPPPGFPMTEAERREVLRFIGRLQ